ncbi:K Homology domain-containing protein [Caenorhabditis elegans]|uniref:K Homology domain-containing protein n=1 Tax=Caenorhabditis elegans TaxID=6239 RepID=Q95Y67_CAEEL|nr:K Homology domain-containing protein [Caenorhabditis elegans]CCD73932.1 K Homology domain-containing protein [Caenorhabditis elegans]|eukprot:NP_497351.3 Patterned Expression Site [Caenorhabditis elegans]
MDPSMYPGASATYLSYPQQNASQDYLGAYAAQTTTTTRNTANGSTSSDHLLGDPSSSCSPRETSPSTTSLVLTIRLLMQGKEVGSIIGKKGDQIKKIREESGAKINISDGSCPERIVTITGTLGVIGKAFNMVCNKFEEDMLLLPNSVPKPPITMRVIVPATQCGSLIGKGGSKIKDIREATGASIQVASEMLPHSTERAVTLSGTADAINLCMTQVCQILLEAPPKGSTITYRPKPTFNPLAIATSAATIAAQQQQAQAQQQLAAAALMGGGQGVQVQQQLVTNALLQQHQFAAVQQELAARAALFNQQLMMPGQQQQASQAQEVYLGQHGLIYTANGVQLGGQDNSKAMEAGAAAAAAAQWQGYDMAAMQQQQQQQQQLLNQYALNQSMLIGAPFMKGGPTPPGTTSGKATSSGASAQGAATSSARFHPY